MYLKSYVGWRNSLAGVSESSSKPEFCMLHPVFIWELMEQQAAAGSPCGVVIASNPHQEGALEVKEASCTLGCMDKRVATGPLATRREELMAQQDFWKGL